MIKKLFENGIKFNIFSYIILNDIPNKKMKIIINIFTI